MMINAMKMGREIKTMVGKLDDMQMSERLISVEFFKNMLLDFFRHTNSVVINLNGNIII